MPAIAKIDCCEKTRERIRAYYAKNRERLIERQKDYYRKNRLARLRYARRYRAQNLEKVNAYNRQWYQKNRHWIIPKKIAYKRIRRAMLRGSVGR